MVFLVRNVLNFNYILDFVYCDIDEFLEFGLLFVFLNVFLEYEKL